jgi:hypothetical protein
MNENAGLGPLPYSTTTHSHIVSPIELKVRASDPDHKVAGVNHWRRRFVCCCHFFDSSSNTIEQAGVASSHLSRIYEFAPPPPPPDSGNTQLISSIFERLRINFTRYSTDVVNKHCTGWSENNHKTAQAEDRDGSSSSEWSTLYRLHAHRLNPRKSRPCPDMPAVTP